MSTRVSTTGVEGPEASDMFFAEGVKDVPSLTLSRSVPMQPIASSYVAPHWAGVEELPEAHGMPIVGLASFGRAAVSDVLEVTGEAAVMAAKNPGAAAFSVAAVAVLCVTLGSLPAFAGDTSVKAVSVPELHVRAPNPTAPYPAR